MKALLATIQERGVVLSVEGDRLKYRSQHGAMPGDLLAAIRAHKTELIRLLTPGEQQQGKQVNAKLRCHNCANLAGCSMPADGNVSFTDLCACNDWRVNR